MLTVEDIAEILQVGVRTAYKIMHQMPHLQRPMRCTEQALTAWIAENTVEPLGRKKAPVKRQRTPNTGPWKIERRRA